MRNKWLITIITLILFAIGISKFIKSAKLIEASGAIKTLRIAAGNYIAAGNMTFKGISINELKNNGFLQSSFGINPWGGLYEIKCNPDDTTHFDIILTNAPTKLNYKDASNISYNEIDKIWRATF